MTADYEALQQFVDGLPVGLVILSPAGATVLVNTAALSMAGVDAADLLARGFVDAAGIGGLKEALKRAEPDCRSEFTLEHAGRYLKCTVWHDAIDEGDTAIAITDATEFRNIEIVKREFLSTILHRMRGPLCTLKTSLGLLGSGAPAVDGTEAREVLEMALHEADRLAVLLDDLRDLFYIETGLAEKDLVHETFTAAEVLDRAIHDLEKPPAAVEHVRDRVRVQGQTDARIGADFARTKRIVATLVENACRYSAAFTPVELKVNLEGNRVGLTVRDRGVGVAGDKKHLLFTKFFREDNDVTRTAEGNGLGLFISRAFAQLMGGTLLIDSQQGVGTTAVLSLPAAKE